MDTTQSRALAPNPRADDKEIRRYGTLLDGHGIGLLVLMPDASLSFRNALASKLFGEGPLRWINESGQPVSSDDLPTRQVLSTSQPVFDCTLTLANDALYSTRMSVDAYPVFAENGGIRCVVLVLTNIRKQHIDPHERDPLSGVLNQRRIMQRLETEIHRARRYGTPFTLAQIDVDQFTLLCTKHGQSAGNTLLADIGSVINECMREIDVAGRIGDSEFLLILPNVCLKDAMVGLERLRALIEIKEFTSARLRVSISGGITEFTGENSARLLEQSKSLLCQAREAGGNRYCLDADII